MMWVLGRASRDPDVEKQTKKVAVRFTVSFLIATEATDNSINKEKMKKSIRTFFCDLKKVSGLRSGVLNPTLFSFSWRLKLITDNSIRKKLLKKKKGIKIPGFDRGY